MVGTSGLDIITFRTGISDCEDDPVSGRLIVGTVGADRVTSGIVGSGLGGGLSPEVAIEGDSVILTTVRSRS
jgi:hypothetical protein